MYPRSNKHLDTHHREVSARSLIVIPAKEESFRISDGHPAPRGPAVSIDRGPSIRPSCV